MAFQLDDYIASLPGFSQNTRNQRWLVTRFAYFLQEVGGETISPENLRWCYEEVSLSAPRNISDVMAKSRAFVKTRSGWKLHRDTIAEIKTEISVPASKVDGASTADTSDKSRNVVIVYGRDEQVRASMFQFVRALNLNPIEWSEAIKWTGRGSPYIGQVLDSLFAGAQAIIVLLTPDEEVSLKATLRTDEDSTELNQPRPNVLIEAGMALVKDESHTIIVQVGKIRSISDLSGRHVVHLNNSAESRLELAQRLETAGCAVSTAGRDWLKVGKFLPT